MNPIMYVVCGGALGALSRYMIALGVAALVPKPWLPWGTIIANLTGCFLIGALSQTVLHSQSHDLIKYMLIVGFCGALTTFSSFGLEAFNMMESHQHWRALTDVLLQMVFGYIAVFAGVMLFRANS